MRFQVVLFWAILVPIVCYACPSLLTTDTNWIQDNNLLHESSAHGGGRRCCCRMGHQAHATKVMNSGSWTL